MVLKLLKDEFSPQHDTQVKNYLEINQFTNQYAKTWTTYSIHQLTSEMLINTTGIKDNSLYYHFNRLISPELGRTKLNCDLPLCFILDIDIKEMLVFNQIKADTGIDFKTEEEAADYVYDCLKNDNKCLYIDKSFSDKGVKAVLTFVSDLYLKYNQEYVKDPSKHKSKQHEDILDELHSSNFEALCEYLTKFNLKFHNGSREKGKKIDYIDSSLKTITTGTYQSHGHFIVLNPNYDIFYYQIDKNKSTYQKLTKILQLNYQATLTPESLTYQNNKWFIGFRNFYISNRDKRQEINNKICSAFEHYNTNIGIPMLFSLKHSSDQVQQFFYDSLRYFNSPESAWKKQFQSFSQFQHYLNKMRERGNKTRPLSDFFKDIFKVNQTIEFKPDHDFFNRKFNKTFYFDTYLSSIYDRIKNEIINNKTTILKSPAGTGKTTTLIDILVELISDKGYIVICIPKNALLIQLQEIIKQRYPKIPVYRNFGKDRFNYHTKRNGIILSSTPKLQYLTNIPIEILLVDEIHNLVAYGKKIRSILPYTNKLVLTSATPEPYLIGLKYVNYINCVASDEKKAKLDIILTNNTNKTLIDNLDPNRKQLVFYNNIAYSKKIVTNQKDKIQFELINAKEKTNHSKEILLTQNLTKSHYFCTSYINDGINFLNTHWDDVFIIESTTTSPFDIYQLSRRFRKANPNFTYIRRKKQNFGKLINLSRIDKGLKNKFEKVNELVTLFNEIHAGHDYKDIMDVDNVQQNFRTERFEVNLDGLKYDNLENNFGALYKTYDDIMEDSLAYYFDIEVNQIMTEEKVQLYTEKDLQYQWELFWKEIITYPQIDWKTLIDDAWDTNANKQLLCEHQDWFENKIRQYKKVEKYNMEVKDTFCDDITFTRRLNKAKKRFLANYDRPIDFESPAFLLRQTIDQFRNDIINNITPIIHKKKGVCYDFKIICDWFKTNDRYKQYRTIETIKEPDETKIKYLFKPNEDSIAIFINKYFNKLYRYCTKNGTIKLVSFQQKTPIFEKNGLNLLQE
jgi:hypothetical protein